MNQLAQEKEESKKVNEQKTLAQELSETQSKLQQQKLEKEQSIYFKISKPYTKPPMYPFLIRSLRKGNLSC